jgi:hypothetical protein
MGGRMKKVCDINSFPNLVPFALGLTSFVLKDTREIDIATDDLPLPPQRSPTEGMRGGGSARGGKKVRGLLGRAGRETRQATAEEADDEDA